MRRSWQSSRRGESRNHSKARLLICSAASLAAAHLASNSALGASGTWNQPSGNNYDFVDPANWLGGNVPGGVDAIFDMSRLNLSGGFNIALNANRTIGQLLVSDLDVSSTTNVNFGGTGILTLSTTVGGPILNVAGLGVIGNNFVQIDNVIAGNQGLEKQGTGTVTFTGVNTYSGTTTITAGTLRVLSASGLGTSTVLLNGGGLELRNDNATNFGVGITLAVSSTLTVDNNTGGSGLTHTIGAVNFGGAGAKTLTITSANSFGLNTGAVTLSDVSTVTNNSGGLVTLASVNSTAAAATTLNLAGTGSVTVSGAITQGAGTLTIANTSNHMVTLNGALSNTGGVAVTGGGTTLLGSGISLPAGAPVSVTNGVLDLGNNSSTAGAITMGGNSGTILTGTGTLTLGGDVTFNTGGGSANIVGNLNLGAAPRTFNIALGTSGSWDMVVNGPVGDSGGGFVKTGAGRLRLTGNNSSTGQVTVNAGTLQADALASGSTLGSGTLAIGGGTLLFQNLSGGVAAGSTGTLVFGGTNSTGTLSISANGQGNTTLNLTAIGGRTAGSTGVLTIAPTTGALGGSEILTVTNAPTGSLLVNGMLPAYMTQQPGGNDNAIDFLSTSGNQIVGATYNTDINAGATAIVAPAADVDISNATKQIFALKLNSHTVNGSSGTLIVGDDTNPGGVILNGGSTINVSNLKLGPTGASEGIIWSSGGTGNITSAITLNNTLTTAGTNNINFSGPITFGNSAANINVNGASVTLSGSLVSGNLTKQGPSVLNLTGNYSTFAGSFTANAGTLQFGDGGSNGTLGASSKLITNSNIAFNRNDTLVVSNAISGTGNIVQNGSGTLTMTGSLAYTGSTIVNNGVLQISANDQLPTGNPLVVNGSGTFAMNAKNQTVNGLNGSGTVTNNGSTLSTLTLTGNGAFSGTLNNGATGTIALVKTGTGSQLLSAGAQPTYSGGTTISGGTLAVGNAAVNDLGPGTITFMGGALVNNAPAGNQPSYGQALNVPTGQVGTLNMGNRIVLGSATTGTLTGGGVLNLVANTNVTRDDLKGTWNAFTGTVNVSGTGTIRAGQNFSTANPSILNMPSAWLDLSGQVLVQPQNNSGGNTYNVGGLSGSSAGAAFIGSGAGGGGTLTIGALNQSSTFAGNFQGNWAINKTGTGTMTFTGASTMTGNATITNGTMKIDTGGDFSTTPQIQVTTAGTLSFAGTGTLSGNSTRINNLGTLTVPSGFATPRGVTLTGTGKVVGNYVHSAGTINPNTDGTAGILTFNNDFTLSPGATIGVDLTNPGGVGVAGGVNDLVSILGNFTLNAPSTASSPVVRAKFLGTAPGVADVGKTFPFLQYTGTATGLANIGNIQVAAGFRGSLAIVQDPTLAKTLDVKIVSVTAGAANLTWTGNLGNVWDINATANWKIGNSPSTYIEGDNVAFLGDGSSRVISLSTIVSPSSMLFDAPNGTDYSINGTGAINGSGALVKNNTNTVTLGTNNAFTGGTTINDGTILINNLNALGTGSVTFNGGTLDLQGIAGLTGPTLPNAIVVSATANGTIIGGNANSGLGIGAITGSGTLTLNRTNVMDLRGDISTFSGTLGFAGNATVRLNGPTGSSLATFDLGDTGMFMRATGVTNFNIGALKGNSPSTLGGSGNGATQAVTYTIGAANRDTQFDGIINDGVSPTSIVKVGTATQVFTNGGMAYTGSTTVNGGTLMLDNGGAIHSASIVVNTGGTLAIGGGGGNFNATAPVLNLASGSAFNVAAQNNYSPPSNLVVVGTGGTIYGEYNHNQGTLSPGTGTLTVGTLNFNDKLHLNGGSVQFDLNTGTTVGGGTNDLIAIAPAGTVDFQSTTPLFVNFLTTPAAGSDYTLMTYSHETGSAANLTLATRANANLVDTGTALMLHVTSFTGATLTWRSTQNNNWDVATSTNWINGTGAGDKFFQLDAVAFDDANGVNTTVQIDQSVSPSSIVVNSNNNNYTFQGNGTISGATSLTKNGNSTLTIATNNNYTGGTTINAGTLAVTSAQPFTGTVTINNGAALAAVSNGSTLTFGTGATYVIPGGASGTISLISNNGGSNTIGVGMTGTLNGGTTGTGATANILITNTNTGATLPVFTDVTTNNSAFIGTINLLNNGTTTLRFGGNAGSPTAFFNLGSAGTLGINAAGQNVALGALTGQAGSVLQGFISPTAAAGGGDTYSIGSLNTDTTFAGAIVDGVGTSNSALSITKVGTAKLTLSGSNTYTGTTTISGGTLALGAGGSINNSGTLNLAGGAFDATAAGGYSVTSRTFTGSGTVFGAVTHNNGTLTPAGTTGPVGTLAFANGLSIGTEAINVDLATAGTIGGGVNDLIDVTGALSLAGTSTVNANFLQNPTVGNYPILRYTTGTPSAANMTLGAIGLRGTASLDFSQAGVVNVAISALTPASLSWRGAGNSGGLWDVNTTLNWLNAGANDKFFQFDSVSFLDTAGAPTTVSVSAPVSPGNVLVNSNSNSYTFAPTASTNGTITGPGSLTKQGTSTLTVTMNNSYLGGTTISGGTINTGSLGSGALGSGSINLSGGAVSGSGTGTVFFSTRVNAAAGTTSTLAINGTGAVGNISGNLTGTGTVNLVSDNTGKLFDLNGSNSTFGGAVVLPGTQTIRLGGTGGSGAAVWSLPGGGTLSSSAGTTSFTTTEFLGALNGAATSTLYGYRAGGTGGNIAYQIGDANVNGTFAGNVVDGISGATPRPVSIIKSGTAKQTFSGSNSYTGGTQVNSGTLAFVGPNAWGPALSGTSASTTGGSVLNGGRMVLDYTGNVPANPASQINTILTGEASGNFLVGQLRTTNAVDGRHAIGWIDSAPTVTIGYTWMGDANVDGMVTTSDFNTLALHFNNAGLATPGSPVWAEGDFNYDGHVNALDFNAVATNFGATPILSAPLGGASLGALVPEPASLSTIGLIGVAMMARRRRRA